MPWLQNIVKEEAVLGFLEGEQGENPILKSSLLEIMMPCGSDYVSRHKCFFFSMDKSSLLVPSAGE